MRAMNLRTIIIVLAAAALGGLALMDYYSADSKKARELSEIQKLQPDVQPPACFPANPHAKLFAAAIKNDQRAPESLNDDVVRRTAIKHDCIRGNNNATVQRLVKALGPQALPLYTEVMEKCPVVKDQYPVYPCFALDALGFDGSKEAVTAMEKALTNKDKARKNVYLGALFRLMASPGWHTTPQLAAMLPAETDWEAKELLIEQIRAKKDPAARDDLQKAYGTETDEQERGKIKAALLEIDNAGRCVVEDEGRGEDGNCRYVCRDQNLRLKIAKQGPTCPLVREAPQQNPPGVAAATAVPPK